MVVGRIEQALQRAMAPHGWPVSFSIGVLTCPNAAASPADVMARVDWLMYQAKTRGKHTVVYAVDEPPAGCTTARGGAPDVQAFSEPTVWHDSWPEIA